MNKPSNFWNTLFEKHDSHPDVTPHTNLGSYWTILFVGLPLLLVMAAISWFLLSR